LKPVKQVAKINLSSFFYVRQFVTVTQSLTIANGKIICGKYAVVYYTILLTKASQREIPSLATTWMELENITLHKISQSQKDKHHIVSPTIEIYKD
jgi:hypothetical protein